MADRQFRNRSRGVVFLCYHSVAPAGPKYLTITPELFETHLRTLTERGFATGDLASLETIVTGGQAPPTVFLTFDDGFVDNYETVLPLLRERGMRAFLFVLPPLVDTEAPLVWPEVAADARRFPHMRSVGWEMLEEMKEQAFEVGAHTLTHPHLPHLDDDQLREEIWQSRARVKARLGSCDTFAYPFGEWSPRVAAAAADCGYRFAFSLPTERGQREADRLTIPRVNVDYRDSGRRFAAKLSPAGRALYLAESTKAARRTVRRIRQRG
jgi:peptidoglycan/xylan/chitin deacetylase (PgdA/CDA1 family)